MDMKPIQIPKEVGSVLTRLRKVRYEAYIVGGCVRDILRGAKPKDWDIATNAKPEEIQKIFPKSFYENKFFTVGVETRSKDSALAVVEVTTFRSEAKYTDKRHPDEVRVARTIEEDLSRRDFTINALAMAPNGEITDPFGGKEDIENKRIRAVGKAEERFQEDALRMMRAVRLAITLEFQIEEKTREAIQKHATSLQFISKERIRDELVKILEVREAMRGVELLEETGLLRYILPELRDGIDVGQNKHHIYTVWEHNLRSLDWAARAGYNLDVRVASLLHDIGKPKTKEGEGPDSTFYAHQVVGAKIAARTLERLRFPRKNIEKIVMLIRNHMFVYNVGEVTERSVRRLVSRVGLENMDDLIHLRMADRKGSGVPKAQPYRLRHFRYIVDKISRDPISPKMLKIKGDEVMETLSIEPGPMVGQVISILLDEVLDDPEKNTKKYLLARVKKIGKLKRTDLIRITEEARKKTQETGEGIEEEAKKKYWVK